MEAVTINSQLDESIGTALEFVQVGPRSVFEADYTVTERHRIVNSAVLPSGKSLVLPGQATQHYERSCEK